MVDYSVVTEVTGNRITSEALSMMYTRYHFATKRCVGRDVLEVACGAGQGLGYLARNANKVVGGDYTEKLVHTANRHYQRRLPIVRLDAQSLPFHEQSFDMVILYEAIYYLSDPERFCEECRRVLRANGMLLICSANKEWADHNPSPYSRRYFSAGELSALMRRSQFRVELYGGFPIGQRSVWGLLVSLIKRSAVALGCIPKTMTGKELLKRIFLGRLVALPPEIRDGMAEEGIVQPIPSDTPITKYKVIFAIGHRS